jgi:NADPH:quinone reductase
MAHAFRIREFGGPQVLTWSEAEPGEPGPGQARVAHTAVGLNMIDTYYRSGLYPLELPSGIGSEAAGVVISTGAGVDHLAPGDRVAYASPPPLDGYSETRLIDARWLVKLPERIDDERAAAMMLKGMTAWYLLNRSYPVRAGEWMLLHAAAGGVGLIAAQWGRHLGARVVGVVGSDAKREIALAHGCEHVLLADEDIPERVRELTGGDGVAVVYDSIGRRTFVQSLDCLRPHGCMVSFGNASGPVEPFSLFELTRRGSLYVTRPMLFDFVSERDELEAAAGELFDLVGSGVIRIEINQRHALADAPAAHRNLEERRTTGSTVLIP